MSDWLYRDLIQGPYLRLCLTEHDYLHEVEELDKISQGFAKPGAACLCWHKSKNGSDCAIVCIDLVGLVSDKREAIGIAALLVHEAVHVFQRFCRVIGETEPSSEFEAYSIQQISQRLMQSYVDQTTMKGEA